MEYNKEKWEYFFYLKFDIYNINWLKYYIVYLCNLYIIIY